MKKMVPVAQAGYDNIQNIMNFSCDQNTEGVFTAVTTERDYFDEKTKILSAPFKQLYIQMM